jgi:hypothetical protein
MKSHQTLCYSRVLVFATQSVDFELVVWACLGSLVQTLSLEPYPRPIVLETVPKTTPTHTPPSAAPDTLAKCRDRLV